MAKKKWGGYRPGSGRRPKSGVSGVSHHTRPELSGRHPVQVVLDTKPELGNLRKKRIHEIVRMGLVEGCDTGGFRICHYSVQKFGLRMIVEARNREMLSRGMQGINVRLAKGLNRLWSRNGSVFTDRYAIDILSNGRKVRDSLCFVLNGALSDSREASRLQGKVDPYSSGVYFDGWDNPEFKQLDSPAGNRPVARPRTALLRQGWKKYGLIGMDEVPSAATARADKAK